eukprot:CAMPEP_0184357156 /NCGR_PEP_ID=MMETSP1089-20130417/107313_1 /TAXON_ID=38269 ORGANISM="Gloeochaete wittrockiana, Strain SAG46.84" /NCGR_SAMPLE_ID=MMETSP1089 /ASSEMBLY_ACC=CAM_ASM_000445 /LENGTH=74 /DNA_ID=CAMNT_0026694777 /DNA_START=139 /DNA_END=363 /DNA_ORIENTATION=-
MSCESIKKDGLLAMTPSTVSFVCMVTLTVTGGEIEPAKTVSKSTDEGELRRTASTGMPNPNTKPSLDWASHVPR